MFLFFYSTLLLGPENIPSGVSDSEFFVWNFWWVSRCLEQSVSIYFSKLIFAPAGASLYLHTLVEGLALPISLLLPHLSPQQHYTLASILCFFLNGVSSYVLFRSVSGSFLVGLVLALLLSFHPYFFGHLFVGHINLLCFFPVPLATLAFLKMRRSVSSGLSSQAILLGICLGSLCYLSLNYLYFTALLLAAYLLIDVVFYRRKFARKDFYGLLLEVGVFSLIAGPKVYQVASLAASGKYTPDHDPRTHSADIASFLLPSATQKISELNLPENFQSLTALHRGESSVYLSYSLILTTFLLLVTLLFSRSTRANFSALIWLPLAGFFLLLSLGPLLRFQGQSFYAGYVYRFFDAVLPFFPAVPARFSVIVIYCLLLFVAEALRGLSRKGSIPYPALLLLLTILAFFELYPAALSSTRISGSPALLELKQDSAISSIHDFGNESSAMARQIFHEKSITHGYIARRPKKALRRLERNPFIKYISDQAEFSDFMDLREGFDQLGVQALLFEEPVWPESERRVSEISWLRRCYTDEVYMIFCRSGE